MKMIPGTIGAMALAYAFFALAGCSKDVGAANTSGFATATPGTTTVASSVCQRHILTPEDTVGILSASITGIKLLPGDVQSCEFTTAGFPAITISVRPGLGRTTVDAWATGKMPLATSPLPGVGEAAVWQAALHEVIAEKDNLLCDIQVRGGGSDLALGSEGLPAALGALCNKIFAAY